GLGFGDAFLVLSKHTVEVCQTGVGKGVARITLGPKIVGIYCLADISGDIGVVERGDAKFFALADVCPQVIGFAGIFAGGVHLAEMVVSGGESGIGESEVRVEFDRALIMNDRSGVAFFAMRFGRQGERVESVERRRRGLLERRVVLANRGER